ncbi:MAG TPA: T9SS type A sorting domain-containing protein, partial [Flavobacteriales bacterium]|nr:T9SS type A sorting domain-containing protein [Flavobacteriales bacterium]
SCDDGNADTGNDVYNAFCTCVGLLIDCQGTPGGLALPGTPCDDGNTNTINDAYDLGCACVGDINTEVSTAGTGPDSFSVQPNPSNGSFAFVNPTQVPTQVTVLDATGRKVLGMRNVTARTTWMDIPGLGAGVYYLHASASDGQQVIKVIIEH